MSQPLRFSLEEMYFLIYLSPNDYHHHAGPIIGLGGIALLYM